MIMGGNFKCPQLFNCEIINANDYSHEKSRRGRKWRAAKINAGLTIEGETLRLLMTTFIDWQWITANKQQGN